MEMNKYLEMIQTIKDTKNDVERVEKLNELTRDYKAINIELQKKIDMCSTLTNERNEYANLNNKLFLQINTQKEQEVQRQEVQEQEQRNNIPKKLSFDDLEFNN